MPWDQSFLPSSPAPDLLRCFFLRKVLQNRWFHPSLWLNNQPVNDWPNNQPINDWLNNQPINDWLNNQPINDWLNNQPLLVGLTTNQLMNGLISSWYRLFQIQVDVASGLSKFSNPDLHLQDLWHQKESS